jgi:hypothetical protein
LHNQNSQEDSEREEEAVGDEETSSSRSGSGGPMQIERIHDAANGEEDEEEDELGNGNNCFLHARMLSLFV